MTAVMDAADRYAHGVGPAPAVYLLAHDMPVPADTQDGSDE